MAQSFFNNSSSNSPDYFQAFIARIENKAPENRSGIEQEILRLYNKAEQEGTEFCANQLKKKVVDHLSSSWAYYILAIVVLIFIVYRSK